MYSPETRVEVYPFTRQPDGEQVIIGQQETNTFLSVSPDSIEVLDLLAEGRSVAEVREIYECRYGEPVDLKEFLEELEKRGFLSLCGRARQNGREIRWHGDGAERLARILFSRIPLTLGSLLILAALGILCVEPQLFPGRDALLFGGHRAPKFLAFLALTYGTLFLHEVGHLLAALAVGVRSRLGFGNRLWILVAETDLTGLWAVPRSRRFLPLLAGMFVDSVIGALLLFLLLGGEQRKLALPETLTQLASALVFVILLRLLWQCFFFLRTDLYYVVAHLFGCRSLLQDTENYLRNARDRLLGRAPRIDQSRIPVDEAWVLRLYAPFYLLGRVVALCVFVLIVLPVTWAYIEVVGHSLQKGYDADPSGFLDSMALALVPLMTTSIGIGLWFASLVKRWRTNP